MGLSKNDPMKKHIKLLTHKKGTHSKKGPKGPKGKKGKKGPKGKKVTKKGKKVTKKGKKVTKEATNEECTRDITGNDNHYKESHCTPFKDNKLPYSCLSQESLRKIAKAVNQSADITIDYKHTQGEQLYKSLCNVFENNYNCKTEACWVKVKDIMKQLGPEEVDYLQDYFRPQMPKELVNDYTEWLSNFNIEDVLKKHEENLSDFFFYGAVPIDFKKCSVSDLCKINIVDHKKRGVHKIGIVFNTDESDGPGEHWISMYIDLVGTNLDGNPGIYFFDSFGSKPMKEVKDLIALIQKQGAAADMEFVVSHNDKSFQRNSYACGFYCMHFIEHMLRGQSFKDYLQSGLTDKKMRHYINQCYLHPKEIKY